MENSNNPAFPVKDLDFDSDGVVVEPTNGLTKREYAAIMAMQGIFSNENFTKNLSTHIKDTKDFLGDSDESANKYWHLTISEIAVKAADSLLEQLEK